MLIGQIRILAALGPEHRHPLPSLMFGALPHHFIECVMWVVN